MFCQPPQEAKETADAQADAQDERCQARAEAKIGLANLTYISTGSCSTNAALLQDRCARKTGAALTPGQDRTKSRHLRQGRDAHGY
jgi:hypothetical protein